MDELDEKIANLVKKQTPQVTPGAAQSRAKQKAEEFAKRKAAAQQRKLFTLLGLAVIANAILAFVLYGFMVVKATHEHESARIDDELTSRLKNIEQFIAERQGPLDRIAKNNLIIQAAVDQHAESLQLLEQSFQSQFDDVLLFKIFPAGTADITTDDVAPIRFAALDLIRRAERNEQTFPEATQVNNRWQVRFVSPLINETKIVGIVYLVVSLEPITKAWSNINKSLGENSLVQKYSGVPPLTVFSLGNGDGNAAVERPVPNSIWEIKFAPSNSLKDAAEESPALFIVAIGLTTALSLFLALVLSRVLVRKQDAAEKNVAPTLAEVAKLSKNSVDTDALSMPLYQAQNMLDISVINEDENILGLENTAKKKQAAEIETIDPQKIPAHIFRAYDVRGVYGKDLTDEFAFYLGMAVGSAALDKGEQNLLVARDGRLHSPSLTREFIKGVLRTGCNVINLGVIPTPLLYFATYHYDDSRSGVVVTASHNPKEYNGFKVVINNQALSDDAVTQLRTRILSQNFHRGLGQEFERDVIPHYIERIFSDVALASDVSLVIDAGNAVPGLVAPRLFEELGCQVTPLYCDIDGEFPNHDPDPTQENNLFALIEKVKEVGADMGVAFDGDGDRLVVVTPKGDIIWPDRLLMLFAKDILARNPGADVLFDVKCSRQLNQVISGYGGRPIMWKTGHSPMKAKMLETGALIGGEYSGHIFIKDRWYGFDDGLYAMARLLEVITLRDQSIDDIFDAFPKLIITNEIKISVPDDRKFSLIEELIAKGNFDQANLTTIDGVRADYPEGWGLVRPSNTSPAITLRFEAETQHDLTKIQQIFKRELLKVEKNLVVKF